MFPHGNVARSLTLINEGGRQERVRGRDLCVTAGCVRSRRASDAPWLGDGDDGEEGNTDAEKDKAEEDDTFHQALSLEFAAGTAEADSEIAVIGTTDDLLRPNAIKANEHSLLEQLTPDLGSPRANWERTSVVAAERRIIAYHRGQFEFLAMLLDNGGARCVTHGRLRPRAINGRNRRL